MASGFGAKGSEGRCYPLWQGFSKVGSFFSRSAARLLVLLFPEQSFSAREWHRESNRISLERREVFFFLSKGGGGRLLLRTLGTPMRCSRRDVESFFWRCRSRRDDFFVVVVFFWLGLSATTAKTKRDGNNARESSRRIDFTHHGLLFFFSNSFAKIACIFIKRRQRKQCMSTAEDPSECKDVREDYLECLHHKKEFQRANAIQAEADRQRGEEATKIWAKIEKHVNDTSWGEVKKEGEGEKAS